LLSRTTPRSDEVGTVSIGQGKSAGNQLADACIDAEYVFWSEAKNQAMPTPICLYSYCGSRLRATAWIAEENSTGSNNINSDTSYHLLAVSPEMRAKFLGWTILVALLLASAPRANAQAAIYHTEMWGLSPGDNLRFNTTGNALSGELVQLSDGAFYAVASTGGANNSGAILTFKKGDPQPTPIFSFSAASGPQSGPTAPTNSDGVGPEGGLVLANDGFLYGTTSTGGQFGSGAIFRVSTAGVLTTLHTFSATDANGLNTDGSTARAKLVQANDGNLYGTTVFGGPSAEGVIFRISPSGVFSIVFAFPAVDANGFNVSGTQPSAPLILASDGNLYGVAERGGANGLGTVFAVTPAGQFSLLHTFSAGPTATNFDGGLPAASLMQARDGNLYGTTSAFGDQGFGTIFRITLQGVFTTMYSFNDNVMGANPFDSANPAGPLVEGPDGTLYGTAAQGGGAGFGTVFTLSPSGTYSLAYSFGAIPGTGGNPSGGLIFGADGNLYGITLGQAFPDFFSGLASTAFVLASTSAPSLVNLSVSPASAFIGDDFTLSWSSPTSIECAFFTQQEIGPVAPSGTITVSVGVAGTFPDFLTCTTPLGDANTYVLLTVLTPVPTVTLSASPTSFSLGNFTTLTWTSTGDADCAGNFGLIVQNGSQPVTPTSTGVSTYTATCTNAGGTASARVDVTVTAAVLPTVKIAVSPVEIAAVTGTATLTWSSTGAPSCTASGAWSGSQSINGNSPLMNLVAGQYTYTLTCTGPGGSASASATLKVDAGGGGGSGGGGTLSWWMIVWLIALTFVRFAATARVRN
jgi:uncharacterized repeat protein (TIGR03803 family)